MVNSLSWGCVRFYNFISLSGPRILGLHYYYQYNYFYYYYYYYLVALTTRILSPPLSIEHELQHRQKTMIGNVINCCCHTNTNNCLRIKDVVAKAHSLPWFVGILSI